MNQQPIVPTWNYVPNNEQFGITAGSTIGRIPSNSGQVVSEGAFYAYGAQAGYHSSDNVQVVHQPGPSNNVHVVHVLSNNGQIPSAPSSNVQLPSASLGRRPAVPAVPSNNGTCPSSNGQFSSVASRRQAVSGPSNNGQVSEHSIEVNTASSSQVVFLDPATGGIRDKGSRNGPLDQEQPCQSSTKASFAADASRDESALPELQNPPDKPVKKRRRRDLLSRLLGYPLPPAKTEAPETEKILDGSVEEAAKNQQAIVYFMQMEHILENEVQDVAIEERLKEVFGHKAIKPMEEAANNQRSILVFLRKEGATALEVCRRLNAVFGKSSIQRSTVFRWFKRLAEGRQSLQNLVDNIGRRPTATTQENIDKVAQILLRDPRTRMINMAEEVGVNISSVHNILSSKLGMMWFKGAWVPAPPDRPKRTRKVVKPRKKKEKPVKVVPAKPEKRYRFRTDGKNRKSYVGMEPLKLPVPPRPKNRKKKKKKKKVEESVVNAN